MIEETQTTRPIDPEIAATDYKGLMEMPVTETQTPYPGPMVTAAAGDAEPADQVVEPNNVIEPDHLAEVEVPQEQPEDFGEVAFEAVEHAVETVVEEAETLASEAVTEVKKVWNNSLQEWV